MIEILKVAVRALRSSFWIYRRLILVSSTHLSHPPAAPAGITYRFGDQRDLSRLTPAVHRYDSEALAFASERLAAGDSLVLGEADGQVVFYGWLASGQIDLYCRHWRRVASDCAYAYKLFTVTEARGRGILPGFYDFVRPQLRAAGCQFLVCWIDSSNHSSARAHEKSEFFYVGTFYEFHIFGKIFHFLPKRTLERLRKSDSLLLGQSSRSLSPSGPNPMLIGKLWQ